MDLAAGSRDGTAIVSELSGDGADPIFTRDAHLGRFPGVALSPDGTRLMTAGEHGTTKVLEHLAIRRERPAHAMCQTYPNGSTYMLGGV
jgi:hypothetical protein